jgi:hypothetical protein
MIKIGMLLFLVLSVIDNVAQPVQLNKEALHASKVEMSFTNLKGKMVVRVAKDTTVKDIDEATFAKLNNMVFEDGTIEVKVLSRLLKTAKPDDRGFIGVAFRINEDNSKFECFYIRPTNGRADQQIRRNHATQYFSFPDYKFFRLRKESPEMYESYADMGLDEWIQLKIVVKGKKASLFVNNARQPALIVNDLKHGDKLKGSVGLFVDVGTEGFFSDLKISHMSSN